MSYMVIISTANANPSTIDFRTFKQLEAYTQKWVYEMVTDRNLSVIKMTGEHIAQSNREMVDMGYDRVNETKTTLTSQIVAHHNNVDQVTLSSYKVEAIDIPNFVAYTDDGHGWLAVKRKLLIELGIIELVTHYSYQKGGMVYLEEDCDVSLFFKTMKLKGREFTHTVKNTNGSHPIRSYDRFAAFGTEIVHNLTSEVQQEISWDENNLTNYLNGEYQYKVAS